MQPLPAVVVAAYKRPQCLARLLKSLLLAQYAGDNISLIISLDGPPSEEVLLVAESAQWPFGQKKIISQQQHLGIVQHIFSCGNLAMEFGNIILLEDDLVVSPAYYSYAVQALGFYETCNEIAGISLYGYLVSENSYQPFEPIDDGNDVYLMQVPSSWGVSFSSNQWMNFCAFKNEYDSSQFYPLLPGYVQQWPVTSWKKIFFAFLMQQEKYFVYPRKSLCTNFGDPGTHAVTGGLYQVPLLEKPKPFRLCVPGESAALYDAWFEIKAAGFNRITDALKNILYEVDLYGTKKASDFQADYFLTTRSGGTPIKSYGLEMTPPIANVLHDVPGNKIRLVKKNEIGYNNSALKNLYGPYKWPQVAGVWGTLTLTIGIHDISDSIKFEKTVASIEQQSERVSTVIAVIKKDTTANDHSAGQSLPLQWHRQLTEGGVLSTLALSSGDICCCISSGDVFTPGVLNDVIEIFTCFPEVNWLLGLPQDASSTLLRTVPQQRWSSNMIQQATSDALQISFLSGCVFFRKSLLQKALNRSTKLTFTTFLQRTAYSNEKLFTLARSSAIIETNHTPNDSTCMPVGQMPDGWFFKILSAVTRPFFLNNISFLRFFFYELNRLPDVIRKDGEHGSWYLSRY
jgi:hypothetical protein